MAKKNAAARRKRPNRRLVAEWEDCVNTWYLRCGCYLEECEECSPKPEVKAFFLKSPFHAWMVREDICEAGRKKHGRSFTMAQFAKIILQPGNLPGVEWVEGRFDSIMEHLEGDDVEVVDAMRHNDLSTAAHLLMRVFAGKVKGLDIRWDLDPRRGRKRR